MQYRLGGTEELMMETSTMNDETETLEGEEEVDAIFEAFEAAVSEDKGEDDIKMALIGAGATFKNVTRLYNTYMVDAGFAISKEEKTEIVDKLLDGKDLADEKVFDKAVEAISKKAAGVSEKSAAALIRSFAKANDLECYKKPKGSGGARAGFRSRFLKALVAAPAMDEAACSEYLKTAEGTSGNILKHESVYQAIRSMANEIHAAA